MSVASAQAVLMRAVDVEVSGTDVVVAVHLQPNGAPLARTARIRLPGAEEQRRAAEARLPRR